MAHGEQLSETRFEFGKNWSRFLRVLDEERIQTAEQSLIARLGRDGLKGAAFVDVGSGSGLFSLAARRLGARVHSFDYDPEAVACATRLKEMFLPTDKSWTIERGSALDAEYLASLGQFDIVYSFGVLHHTGDMWRALDNVTPLVAPGGVLWIAIYNDQGRASRRWTKVKRLYNELPRPARFLVVAPACVRLWGPTTIRELFEGTPFRSWRTYSDHRGMTPLVDVTDWVGGYPFEVARPEELVEFYIERGFAVEHMRTAGGGRGNNEIVFRRPPGAS